MDEPNLIVPRPFAAEPLEVLERSTSLDLTPERPAVRKTMSQGLRRSTQYGGGSRSHHPRPPPDLSVPQLHSTVVLQDKIRQLRLGQDEARPSIHHLPDERSSTTRDSSPTTSCNSAESFQPRGEEVMWRNLP